MNTRRWLTRTCVVLVAAAAAAACDSSVNPPTDGSTGGAGSGGDNLGIQVMTLPNGLTQTVTTHVDTLGDETSGSNHSTLTLSSQLTNNSAKSLTGIVVRACTFQLSDLVPSNGMDMSAPDQAACGDSTITMDFPPGAQGPLLADTYSPKVAGAGYVNIQVRAMINPQYFMSVVVHY